ncbi:hypothetical protein GCM10023155_00650 [Bremerella cremea]
MTPIPIVSALKNYQRKAGGSEQETKKERPRLQATRDALQCWRTRTYDLRAAVFNCTCFVDRVALPASAVEQSL